jgi:Ca-activated chloride channel homolog
MEKIRSIQRVTKLSFSISIFLLLALSFKLNQQANISGIITDSQSGKIIKSATVELLLDKTLVSSTKTNTEGRFSFINLKAGNYHLKVSAEGYEKVTKSNMVVAENKKVEIAIKLNPVPKAEIVVQEVQEDKIEPTMYKTKAETRGNTTNYDQMGYGGLYVPQGDLQYVEHNTESYDVINDNNFKNVTEQPVSTFSIDVDRASYANVRRFLNNNTMPPKDAVRVEEMINYFDYEYPQPDNGNPFSINLEMGDCPWDNGHKLLLVGLQGEQVSVASIPPSNFVFLIDVSGSMNSPNKLPLVKQSLKILIDNLRPVDKVAIVVYAGAAGLVLESTPGSNKQKILGAIDQLQAGGSTAGGAGIKLAYKVAKENLILKGNNRVILASDGDFNVGASSDAEMVRLIEEKRNEGVFLTILGYGMGNYKDSKMEQLSNAGNGNYGYIDNILEAKKMFGHELWGTLYTIAKDVKIQVEFNPGKVKAYRLIGYENRLLNREDFNDDKKDAGEIGSGHTVTALYEIVPADSEEEIKNSDPLVYQKTNVVKSDDIMTLKVRYKKPDEDVSNLIEKKITEKDVKSKSLSDNFVFASAVAEFGMLLRNSEFKGGNASYPAVVARAQQAKGNDKYGYRSEFIKLVEVCGLLAN